MKNTTTNKQLAQELADKISTPIYDALVELYNCDAERRNENQEIAPADPIKTRQEIVIDNIEDALDKIEDYNGHDLSDPSTLDFDYMRDTIATEYADGEAELYHYWLWKHAPILSDYIQDAMSEYGNASEIIKERGLIGLLTQGEYYFYSAFINEVIDALENYINELEERTDEEIEEDNREQAPKNNNF